MSAFYFLIGSQKDPRSLVGNWHRCESALQHAHGHDSFVSSHLLHLLLAELGFPQRLRCLLVKAFSRQNSLHVKEPILNFIAVAALSLLHCNHQAAHGHMACSLACAQLLVAMSLEPADHVFSGLPHQQCLPLMQRVLKRCHSDTASLVPHPQDS